MPQDFSSEIGTIDNDLLNTLFEDGPVEGTPNADDVTIGKTTTVKQNDVLPVIDNTDDLFEKEDDDTKTPEQLAEEKLAAETKAKEEKAKADADKKKAEEEEANKNKTPEQLEADKKKADEAEAKRLQEEKDAENAPQVIEALTNTVGYLVKSGIWEDFEGREELEVTPEVYQQLVVAQDKLRLSSQFDELIDSTGDYGKAIISHIRRGGNADDVIDIFKEQKAVEAIDTSTEEGKALKIEKYYKDVVGWKPKKVETFIKDLVANEKVDEEFAEVTEEYDKYHKQQLKNLQAAEDERIAKQEENKERFKTSIKTALEQENTLTPQERKKVEDAILDFKHDVGGGQKVNDFYLKFAEMQKDPAQYIELVRFVMDPKNYKKAISQKAATVEAKKVFTFIKGNSAVKKNPTSTGDDNRTQTKSQSGTNFGIK